ncbi:MAG TPA: rhomboid family intramembrane serine protease [Gemmatimonadaceae bacterium]|nr:rhomboid family intramembrane serine protease [Gemmatimonadaceae bacterium]
MTPWVTRLVIANVIVFLVQMSFRDTTNWLAFIPAALPVRPWTIITYMFAHSTFRITHLLFNMLSLYFFGPRVEMRLGGQRFIRMYLIAGITGGLLSFFTPYAPIVGASGAVFGVQLAFAKFFPREKIFIWGVIPVEARVLVVVMTVVSLWGGLSGGGGIAHFAHLGGYVGAWLYLKLAEKRTPAAQWQAKLAGPAPSAIAIGDWRAVKLESVHELNRDEVQRILVKIETQGEGSLTSQERVFLGHFTPKPA